MAARLLVINPNSTAAMTAGILAVARAAAPPAVVVEAVTNHGAPAAIEGPEDGRAATPGVLAAICDNPGFDGYLIACFDDTGLAEARALSPRPVVGIGEASYLAAAASGPFCVVTTVAEAEPVIAGNIAAAGLADRCLGVKAAGISVLDLEYRKDEAAETVAATITRETARHDVSTVVLGCAGMGGIQAALAARAAATLVEPVAAGVGLLVRRAA